MKLYNIFSFSYTINYKCHSLGRLMTSFLTMLYNKVADYGNGMNSIEYLQHVSPDPHNSCLCKNTLIKDFDLQIIIPVYNVEKYIEECMESVVNQCTRFKYLITVINDGSKDNSRKLLEKYENIPNIIIVDQPNKGLSGARNTALTNIRGRYVMFLDSDDKLAENAIETLMTKACKTKADIVQGSWINFYNGKEISRTVLPEKENLKLLPGFSCMKVFKAELFENIHFPEGYWFEDTIFLLLLFDLSNKMVQISDIVYFYRKNPSGITATSTGKVKALDTFYITKRILEDRKELGLSPTRQLLDKFLSQVLTNFYRTLSLPHIYKITSAIFEESCKLYTEYFSEISQRDCKNFLLEQSLKNKNYKLYLKSFFSNL